jgi:hypothetical protein
MSTQVKIMLSFSAKNNGKIEGFNSIFHCKTKHHGARRVSHGQHLRPLI